MLGGIGVIAWEAHCAESIKVALSGSGLAIRAATTAGSFVADPMSKETLCLIVDLPGLEGLECLVALRRQGVGIPAILIVDPDRTLSDKQIASASILDVLKRPASKRALLSWIECICTACVALDRYRASREPQRTVAPLSSARASHIRA